MMVELLQKKIKNCNYLYWLCRWPSIKPKGWAKVLINNKIAEIFGKISMDLTTIDISKAGKCQIGDWCEFFSKLSINLISDTNSLIPYELMTKITPRVKRKFINDNS